MIIYLDMDGVCTDLVKAACLLHDYHFQEETWPAGQRDLHQVIGVGYDSFWDAIHQRGDDFWRGLESYSWFEQLYDELNKLGRVCFLTTPTNSPYCASGKMMWLKDRFGNDFNDFIITEHKQLLSCQNSLLIDDYEGNIDNFAKRGKVILFPQKWNRAYKFISGDRVDYVLEQLKQIESGKGL